MTIKIPATFLPSGTDPNAVAGASAVELHELTHKLHATESGYEMKLDAMGAETAEDVELAVVVVAGEEGEKGEGAAAAEKKLKKRDLVLKVGSCRRSFVSLPEDADENSVEGTLGDGAFTVRCGKK